LAIGCVDKNIYLINLTGELLGVLEEH